jgi:DNA-binding NtrC family response regulator
MSAQPTPPSASPAGLGNLLVVDDEESVRWFLRTGLTRLGYEVEVASDVAAAERALAPRRFAAAVVDVRLPGASGITFLQHVRAHAPDTVVVMITGYGSIAAAVDAIKRGAFDYITKPFEIGDLAQVLQRALLGKRTAAGSESTGVVAESPAMRAVLAQVEHLKDADVNVLITGESGVGKEVVARALHERSPRRDQPFVAVNCAALPEALIASELFGHAPGAFTGAVTKRTGLLVRADGGTLFLDEVGELRLESQIKLERFLQDREVVPLGSDQPVRVDVRVIAATSRDVVGFVDQGLFRRELYFRLAVVPITVPPLRERPEDIPALTQAALARVRTRSGSQVEGFATAAMAALQGYAWPGNVRELQNLVERVAVLHVGKDTSSSTTSPRNCAPPDARGSCRLMAGWWSTNTRSRRSSGSTWAACCSGRKGT